MVVQHELVHVLRGDALRHLLWRLVVALYWFHPLARLAAREASVVGEHACDETVLDLGTRPSAYARHLLEIAESLSVAPRRLAHALPMVERSQLERRLHMILDHDRPAGHGRALAAAAAALLAGTVAAVGAATPATSASPAPAATTTRAVTATAPARAATAATPARATAPASTAPAAAATATRRLPRGDERVLQRDHRRRSVRQRVERHRGRRLHPAAEPRRRAAAVRHGQGPRPLRRARRLDPRAAGRQLRLRRDARAQGVAAHAGDRRGQGAPRYEWWLDGTSRPDRRRRSGLAGPRSRGDGGLSGDRLDPGSGRRAFRERSGRSRARSAACRARSARSRVAWAACRARSDRSRASEGGMEGRIGGQEGAIGGLEGRRWQASAAEKARIDEEIATHRAAIEKLRAEMASRQFDRRIAEAQAELQARGEEGERRDRRSRAQDRGRPRRREDRRAGAEDRRPARGRPHRRDRASAEAGRRSPERGHRAPRQLAAPGSTKPTHELRREFDASRSAAVPPTSAGSSHRGGAAQ